MTEQKGLPKDHCKNPVCKHPKWEHFGPPTEKSACKLFCECRKYIG